MPSLAERQEAFTRAILDIGLAAPPGLVAPPGARSDERFAVYRNNVAVGQIEALRAAFPVVDRLVGGEFFSAMARAHVLETLPSSPVLLAYGGAFPDFIRRFEPARELPYLGDVAQLEWLWLDAYHAADAEPLTLDAIDELMPEEIPLLRFRLQPSLRLAHFTTPALSIWRHHERPDDPGSMMLADGPEYVLLVRPRLKVSAIELTSGAFLFVDHLKAGENLATAARAALDVEPALDLDELLQLLFAAGAFEGFSISGAPSQDEEATHEPR